MSRRPPRSTLFPYTRSSDLRTSICAGRRYGRMNWRLDRSCRIQAIETNGTNCWSVDLPEAAVKEFTLGTCLLRRDLIDRLDLVDRKSTRLNSSHGYISYAVF